MVELKLPFSAPPNHPTRIDPRFKASSVWIPHIGDKDLLGKADLTVNPSGVSKIIGGKGLKEYKTIASGVDGIALPAPSAVYESWFVMLGSSVSTGGWTDYLLGNSSTGLQVGSTNGIVLRASSAVILTAPNPRHPFRRFTRRLRPPAMCCNKKGLCKNLRLTTEMADLQ